MAVYRLPARPIKFSICKLVEYIRFAATRAGLSIRLPCASGGRPFGGPLMAGQRCRTGMSHSQAGRRGRVTRHSVHMERSSIILGSACSNSDTSRGSKCVPASSRSVVMAASTDQALR
jgi:hypothetical protein